MGRVGEVQRRRVKHDEYAGHLDLLPVGFEWLPACAAGGAGHDVCVGTVDRALGHPPTRPRVFVLDVVGMHDIDFTGARALNDVLDELDELDRQHIAFALTRAGNHLREDLARSGLPERIGEDRLFRSVDDAVKALGPENSTS